MLKHRNITTTDPALDGVIGYRSMFAHWWDKVTSSMSAPPKVPSCVWYGSSCPTLTLRFLLPPLSQRTNHLAPHQLGTGSSPGRSMQAIPRSVMCDLYICILEASGKRPLFLSPSGAGSHQIKLLQGNGRLPEGPATGRMGLPMDKKLMRPS